MRTTFTLRSRAQTEGDELQLVDLVGKALDKGVEER